MHEGRFSESICLDELRGAGVPDYEQREMTAAAERRYFDGGYLTNLMHANQRTRACASAVVAERKRIETWVNAHGGQVARHLRPRLEPEDYLSIAAGAWQRFEKAGYYHDPAKSNAAMYWRLARSEIMQRRREMNMGRLPGETPEKPREPKTDDNPERKAIRDELMLALDRVLEFYPGNPDPVHFYLLCRGRPRCAADVMGTSGKQVNQEISRFKNWCMYWAKSFSFDVTAEATFQRSFERLDLQWAIHTLASAFGKFLPGERDLILCSMCRADRAGRIAEARRWGRLAEQKGLAGDHEFQLLLGVVEDHDRDPLAALARFNRLVPQVRGHRFEFLWQINYQRAIQLNQLGRWDEAANLLDIVEAQARRYSQHFLVSARHHRAGLELARAVERGFLTGDEFDQIRTTLSWCRTRRRDDRRCYEDRALWTAYCLRAASHPAGRAALLSKAQHHFGLAVDFALECDFGRYLFKLRDDIGRYRREIPGVDFAQFEDLLKNKCADPVTPTPSCTWTLPP